MSENKRSTLITRYCSYNLRCGGIVNVHFLRLATTLLKDEKSARDKHVLVCNFAKYSPIKKITDRLSNKPFLIWLLTAPVPHRTLGLNM